MQNPFNGKKTIDSTLFLKGYLFELFMRSRERLTSEEYETFLKLWKKIQGNKNDVILP